MNARVPTIAELSPEALELGRERVCKDLDLYADWLAGSDHVREMSLYFGAISVPELVEIQLNPKATAEQVHVASCELRNRFLDEDRIQALVLQYANEAMA